MYCGIYLTDFHSEVKVIILFKNHTFDITATSTMDQ